MVQGVENEIGGGLGEFRLRGHHLADLDEGIFEAGDFLPPGFGVAIFFPRCPAGVLAVLVSEVEGFLVFLL